MTPPLDEEEENEESRELEAQARKELEMKAAPYAARPTSIFPCKTPTRR